MTKNGRTTIGNELMDQLNESSIDLLTAPVHRNGTPAKATKIETVKVNQAKKAKTDVPQNEVPESGRQARQAKERMTVQISKDTIERVKDAVYWERLTVAQLVEDALEEALKKLEKQRGEPYQKRKAELKPGRPLK